MLDDERLVQNFLNGEEKAFEELFERHRNGIFQFILRMLSSRQVAEEVFQDVFLQVYRKLGTYRSEERFSAWIFTIARRACLDALRKRKRERWLLFGTKVEDLGGVSDPERDFSRSQMKERIMKELEKLDPVRKEIFLLRIHGNLLFREIADLMNIPLNTVLARYHQAVLSLKDGLQRERT